LPWLDDANHNWKDLAVSEYYAHNIASGFAMIRRGNYKYVYHTAADADHPAERELYDLQNDPGEFDNLAAAAEYRQLVEEMHAALVREIGEDPDQSEQRCRADYARGYERNTRTGEVKTSNPPRFALSQNYPNPFNDQTVFSFYLPRPERVRFSIYSESGQLVDTLIDGHKDPGNHFVTWEAKGVNSGTYLCRLIAGEFSQTRKCTVLK